MPRRLKILNVAWNANGETWGRFRPQFDAIQKHHDVIFVAPFNVQNIPWIKWIQVPNIGPRRWNWKQHLAWVTELLTQVPDFDLVYCRNGAPVRQLTDALTGLMFQKPVVMKLGGNGREVRKHYQRYANPIDRLHEDVTDLSSICCMDALVPLSKKLQRDFKAWVKDPGRVTEPVYLSIDFNQFRYMEPPEVKIFGYAGRLSPEKGINLLHEVMSRTRDLNYWLAGAAEGMEELEWTDNVSHKGLLTMDQMPGWYSFISAFLLPSHSEGMPNVILEAYASGRPVFVAPETLPEELPLFGWCLPMDPDVWVKKLREVQVEELQEKGLQARIWLEENWPTWDDFGSGMSEVFLKTVEAREVSR